MLLNFKGIAADSDFRLGNLLAELRKFQPSIRSVSSEYIHFADTDKELDDGQKKALKKLLDYGSPYTGNREGEFFLVVPRPGTISPWSSKATSIAHASGLRVNRIERGTAYYIKSDDKLADKQLASLLHDRMTETVFDDLKKASSLFENHKPKPLTVIDVLKEGKSALKTADKQLGLALSDEEIDYLYDAYLGIKRNPTDLELMMFGVVNSEHCRHKIFNADWFIDGKKQPKSLFKMIKNTYEKNPGGVISAYSDNSAVLNGHKEKQLLTDPKTGIYKQKPEQSHLVIKVETHNHPTAIAPFPGAATGAGGEIRDENATGRGARAKMGLTGFSVSNLRIPGLPQPWEINSNKPDTIASPLEIMIKGPLGGASFNNEFGRPVTAGYFRTYEARQNDNAGESWGYHKPIMIAGGVGSIRDAMKDKRKIKPGAKLVVIGGPAMLIGLAGGAASSMESGASDAELDFASVQRGNAEIQRRAFEVIDQCANLGDKNPIISIHDVGAGGLSNALTELVHDSDLGAQFELRNIDSAEPGLSPMEIWCNEAQERYVLAIEEHDIPRFEQICSRERCPYSIVGETTEEKQLVINDALFANRPADIPMSLLFGGPPKITKNAVPSRQQRPALDLNDIEIEEAAARVLQIPAVGSKKFLITIGDRSVGGLIARDQMVGPWQTPVSDVAVSKTGFSGKTGEAMAMGERTPLAIVNAPASARMAISEAVTNIAGAGIGKISDIKLSANWMAASGYKAEDYKLFQTVKTVGEKFCPELDLTIPVGKDSLSMRTVWKENGRQKSVTSPVSLIISAFAPVADINSTLTPQLKPVPDSSLIFIDLSPGKNRMAGSALAQAYSQIGKEVPDVDDPKVLPSLISCLGELREKNLIMAYHDRSDGGLFTTLLEMAFAGRLGIDIDLSKISGSSIEKLFNEELGAVIQVKDAEKIRAQNILNKYFKRNFYILGKPNGINRIRFTDKGQNVLDKKRADLESLWSRTSHQIQRIRDNEACADEEFKLIEDDDDPGINPQVSFEPLKVDYRGKPKVAILREQGVNGQNEMAAAFNLAGFESVDITMHDLIHKKANLDRFHGLAVCGGFSYGDVLGAGQGWAKNILYTDSLREQFKTFLARNDTFSLGVCNGCQMLAALKDIIPGAEHWPKFLKNKSEQFEARLISVKVNESPSIFFSGMEESVLPIVVSHGEGRAVFDEDLLNKSLADNLIPLQYVDNYHNVTETYPLNPNGSKNGVSALTSTDGRALIMMPHPERSFLTYQHSWHPDNWGRQSPWIRLFQNARSWVS
ncbi:MAG TPA: phosphoribosylformylglycinamidine synthase [Candidatus Saccharimonadales bacterium]|nr:phosphoribosylformylglycinamidine synthase [Candidatus Saccharimonadales bacterium]